MSGGVASGATGWVVTGEETTKGTIPALTEYLWPTAFGMTPAPAADKKNYFAGTRFAEVGVRPGKVAASGQIGMPLFPNVGMRYTKHALGKAARLALVASDTTSTGVVTALGISTFTLTTGGAYTQYEWVLLGAGASQEPRMVLSYNAGTKVMTVAALKINAAAASGLAISGPAQHLFSPLLQTDTGFNTLPTSTVECNYGGTGSEQYPGCFVGKYNVKGDSNGAMVAIDMVGTAPFVRPVTPTAFAPSATEYADRSRFFSIMDGYLVAMSDPNATGASSQQAVQRLTGWQLDINNSMAPIRAWDGTQAEDGLPTVGIITGDYTYVNSAGRNAELEDYVLSTSLVDAPIVYSMANNYGTVSAPLWNLWGAVIPHARYLTSPRTDAVNAPLDVTPTFEAVSPDGSDPLRIFCVNSKSTTY